MLCSNFYLLELSGIFTGSVYSSQHVRRKNTRSCSEGQESLRLRQGHAVQRPSSSRIMRGLLHNKEEKAQLWVSPGKLICGLSPTANGFMTRNYPMKAILLEEGRPKLGWRWDNMIHAHCGSPMLWLKREAEFSVSALRILHIIQAMFHKVDSWLCI